MIADYATWAALRDAIAAALRATSPNLDVLVDGIDIVGQPSYRLDSDGRAHMTAVLWMGVGTVTESGDETALDGDQQLGTASWQITAVGGDTDRAVRAAMYTRQAVTGRIFIPRTGRARETFDRVVIAEDTAAAPSRFFTALTYTAETA